LGYVHLGQSATTLSGGEAQRMKLARELSKRQTGRTLYLLDEPTTGLHFDDVRKLLEVLHRLADLGNSVIIIEHNLDVIRNADWILDLGPEGGEDGGRVVAEGRPAKVAATAESYTGQFLARYYTGADGRLTPVDREEELADNAAIAEATSVQNGRVAGDSALPPAESKPKRTRRATPAEADLASTRTKAKRPAKDGAAAKKPGPRKKKTGIA
jgi:excinuclease ABC subunit A